MHQSKRAAGRAAQYPGCFIQNRRVSGGKLGTAIWSLSLWLIAAGMPAVNAAFSPPVAVSAASGTAPVAPNSIISIYGLSLSGGEASATAVPLPLNLGGTSVTLTDSVGIQTTLPLFYAGPTQINAAIPANVHAGTAILTVSTLSGNQTSTVQVAAVAPGLFSANETGRDVAAAQIVTNTADGSQTGSEIYECASGTCLSMPIDVSSGRSALVLYGTGIRNASLGAVSVKIGNQTLPAFFAGAAPTYVGLDQVNVSLPASLAGSGTVNLTVSVNGVQSNVLTVNIAQNTTSIACAGCTEQTNPPYSFPNITSGNCGISSVTRVDSSTLLPPGSWPYTLSKKVWTAGYPDPDTDVDQLLIADVAADGTLQNTTCLSCNNPNAPPLDRFKHFASLKPQGGWILLDVENSDGPVVTQQSSQQLQVQRNNGYWTNLWVTTEDGSLWYPLTQFKAPANGSPGAVGMLNPQWSPDGTMVIFPETYLQPDPANLQGFWRLYVTNFVVDGSGVPLLTNFRDVTFPNDVFYEMQDIAPDNQQLLVQSTANGINTYGVDIYAVSLAAGAGFGSFTDLTNSPYSWDEHALYSPDGKKIVWISSLPFPNIIPQYGGLPWVDFRNYLHNEVFLMNADGSGVQQLTHFNDPSSPEYTAQFGDALYAVWSLDGTQLMIYNGTPEVLVPGGNSTWLLQFAGACGGSAGM